MNVDIRTVVRVFLLVGGLAYVAWGLVEGRTTLILLGVLAAALGAFGLWREGVDTR